MNERNGYVNNLNAWAYFCLFTTSYLPLFALIIMKQVNANALYLNWGGLTISSIFIFIEKFGLSTILVIVTLFGLFGTKMTFKNIDKSSRNGFPVRVKDVKNKSSEAINYIATYIIPFAFQSFDSWFELLSTIGLITIIYRIYINSSLILVNPILSLRYGLFEIEFMEGDSVRSGMIVTTNKFLMEDDTLKLYPIGHKMYYAKDI